MFSTKDKEALKVLGFDPDKLESAAKSEKEETIEVPKLEFKENKVVIGSSEVELKDWLSPEAKQTFGTNRFEEGKKAMSEIKAKELKEKLGVSVDGKDLDKVVEAYGEMKLKEASKGGEWVEEKKKLQGKLTEAEKKAQQIEQDYSKKLFNIELRSEIMGLIPDDTTLPKSDLVDLFMLRRSATNEDGKTIWTKNGEKITDSKLDPLGTKEVVSSFLDEGQYIKKAGMGGGDGGGSGGSSDGKNFKSLAEFNKWCATQEGDLKNPMSEKAQSYLRENKAKEVPDEQFYKAEA